RPLSDLSGDRANQPDLAGIERILAARAGTPDPLIEAAVALSTQSFDVARLAAQLGMSTRGLERRFRGRVGMSPKLFCRIQRFQSVFRVIEEGNSWVSAAAECGYYDQADFIRDSHDFAGETPAALLQGEALARHFLRSR